MSKVGSCQQMCPASELAEHRTGYISMFECDSKGKFDPKLAIKKYSRSAAGFTPDMSNIRPLDVLVRTINYINDKIVSPNLTNKDIEIQLKMYHYVRDRLRAINQDITIQQLHSIEISKIYEYSISFFLWAGIHFRNLPPNDFDFVQNFEQMSQNFLSLLEEYKYFPTKNKDTFQTAHLASMFYMDQFIENLAKYHTENNIQILKSIREAFLTDDIKLFLQIVKNSPFVLAYTLTLVDYQIYFNTISNLRLALKSTSFNKDILTTDFEINNDLNKVFAAFHINSKGDYFTFDIKQPIQQIELPTFIIPASISKIHNEINFAVEFKQILS